MRIGSKRWRSIWLEPDGWSVGIIDQTLLPWEFRTLKLTTAAEAAHAISSMQVRGAPLIGCVGAYGLCLALRSGEPIEAAYELLVSTRPTAINLRWALDEIRQSVAYLPSERRVAAAYARAQAIADDDATTCEAIGRNGLPLIEATHRQHGRQVEVLTHCNAGWLATVDWGTALAPIYAAHDAGIPVHVWVDETRPRNQGAALTAWELGKHGVSHTVIADNAGGHLMQHGRVDLCIVGTDRTTRIGDVCNKIGTYLKALAAHDNEVPFYVALPHSTIDWALTDGISGVPIEERDPEELLRLSGRLPDGTLGRIRVVAEGSDAANFAFDVTPARLVTGLITERGVCAASEAGLLGLYPERK